MITTYGRVLGLPGAFAMSASGVVARLPISMISLGIVVLISGERGSYALAGAVAAAYVVAAAVGSLVQARLMDQFGQFRVLLVGLGVSLSALALLMVSVQEHWANPAPHLLAAVCGAAMPIVGSAVRTRWTHVVPDRSLLQTAFALESVLDEAVFVIGPTLVTILATSVHPLAGLLTAMVAALAGTLVFAGLRGTEPPARGRHPRDGSSEPMGWPVLAPVAATAVCLGILFGGCEVATVAFADERGRTGLAGPLLAIWALGSLLSGLVVGMITWTTPTAVRLRKAVLALGLLLLPLPFVDTFLLMAVCLFFAGLAISPGLIAAIALVEETVPVARLTEGMAVITTALMVGVAPGAALVGWVVDHYGASASYWVPAVAGLLGAAIAFAAAALSARREPRGAVVEGGTDEPSTTVAP